ncbi:hypothetical protein BH10PLA1_BH10PLA1_09910 [soil metagenome]
MSVDDLLRRVPFMAPLSDVNLVVPSMAPYMANGAPMTQQHTETASRLAAAPTPRCPHPRGDAAAAKQVRLEHS